jgi:hypothetical protein
MLTFIVVLHTVKPVLWDPIQPRYFNKHTKCEAQNDSAKVRASGKVWPIFISKILKRYYRPVYMYT